MSCRSGYLSRLYEMRSWNLILAPGFHFLHVWNICHFDNDLSSKCQASSLAQFNIDSEETIGQDAPLTYVCIPP
jgi:hypothetical protein